MGQEGINDCLEKTINLPSFCNPQQKIWKQNHLLEVDDTVINKSEIF
jgi:hypothetical protein